MTSGALLNYRVSWVKEAGFDKFPTNFDDYLKLCKALKRMESDVAADLTKKVVRHS